MQVAALRRQLLAPLLAVLPNAVAAGSALPAPDAEVLLLTRSSFGIAGPDLARVRQRGFSQYVDEQLDPASIDDSILTRIVDASLPTLAMSNAQIIADYARSDDNGTRLQPLRELQAATLARQVFSQRQLLEVMVEFWSNHFNVTHSDGPARYYKTSDDRDVIRRHALGRFEDLLIASAQSPAMLVYLDNASNVVGGPNENYARELMELHTLGVDGGYDEADVAQVARCFTGWSVDTRTGFHVFRFVPLRHDFGAKRVLGVDLPAGQGVQDGLAVLTMLAAHPATARTIASKLVRRFITDFPAAELVQRIADVFSASGGDIRQVVRAVLLSPEFAASADQKLKRPAEYVASALRASAAQVTSEQWLRVISGVLSQLGQTPLNWPAPNGYPDVQSYWLNSGALLQRWNFVLALAEQRLGGALRVDHASLRGSARTPASLVDTLAERVLRRPLAASTRELLIAHVAAGGSADQALTGSRLNEASRDLLGLLLASPYHQYR